MSKVTHWIWFGLIFFAALASGEDLKAKLTRHIASLSKAFSDTFSPSVHDSSLEDVRELQTCTESETGQAFQSQFLVTLQTSIVSSSTLTLPTVESVATSFLSAYDSTKVSISNTVCDPFFRKLENAQISLDSNLEGVLDTSKPSMGLVVVKLTVEGTCNGCGGGGEFPIFDYSATKSSSSSTICGCPAEADLRGPTVEEFTNVFDSILQGSPTIALVSVEELQTKECDDTPIPFSKRVILEYDACQSGLIDNDKALLESLFVSSFNGLAAGYCDPFFRKVESALIVRQGDKTPDGNLPVEVIVNGTLRCPPDSGGCDPHDFRLFEIPTLNIEVSNSRRLSFQNVDSPSTIFDRRLATTTCFCPVDPIAERGITEPEFIRAYQREITNLEEVVSLFDCVDNVADCTFGEFFESTIEINLAEGNDFDVVSQSIEELEAATLRALNDLFAPNDPLVCNPEFRVFQGVEITTEAPVDTRDRQLASEDNQDLHMKHYNRALQTLEPESVAPSTAPSSVFNSNFSFPTAAPTAVFNFQIPLVIKTFGVCNQCTNELFVTNQVSGRSLLSRLLSSETATSNCYCSLDTEEFQTEFFLEDFQDLFVEESGFEVESIKQIENEASDDGSQGGGGEAGPNEGNGQSTFEFPCTNVKSSFNKTITLEVENTCIFQPSLSNLELQRIANTFVETYNSFGKLVCDPFQRSISSAQVIRVGDLRANGTSIPLEVEVTLDCFGCNVNTTNLYGFPEGVFQDLNGVIDVPQDEAGDQPLEATCRCDAELPRRAALELNVTDALDPLFRGLEIDCIGNATTCEFGSELEVSLLVEIVNDGSSDLASKVATLETALGSTLDDFLTVNRTFCNPFFGSVLAIRTIESFVLNSLPRGLNETTAGVGRMLRSGARLPRDLQEIVIGNSTLELNVTVIDGAENETFSEEPSSAPSAIFDLKIGEPVFILLFADGVCNGCPQNLFVENQVIGRRSLIESTTPIYPPDFRELQVTSEGELQIDADVPESNCYCPIGSFVDGAPLLSREDFATTFEVTVAELDPDLIINGTIVEPPQIACSEDEIDFDSILTFRFSAFQEVTSAEDQVTTFGEIVADVYNELVDEFCDPFTRNNITLSYRSGTLRRSPDGNSNRRSLQKQGCLNYEADFTVTGVCRGCDTLQSPIPIFDEGSESSDGDDSRVLTKGRADMIEALRILDTFVSNPQGRSRRLAETCVCDTVAAGRARAVGLTDLYDRLEANVVPPSLPWPELPAICGIPVDFEVLCDEDPNGFEFATTVEFSARRLDDQCLQEGDLLAIQSDFPSAFNAFKSSTYGACSPNYVQLTTVEVDRDVLNSCGTRRSRQLRASSVDTNSNELVEYEMRDLQVNGEVGIDYVGILIRVICICQDFVGFNICIQACSLLDDGSIEAGRAGVEAPQIIETVAVSTNSPSTQPSDQPTPLQPCFGADSITFSATEGSTIIGPFGNSETAVSTDLSTCQSEFAANDGIVFLSQQDGSGFRFATAQFENAATSDVADVAIYAISEGGDCLNWQCAISKSVECRDGCCPVLEISSGSTFFSQYGLIAFGSTSGLKGILLNENVCFPSIRECPVCPPDNPTCGVFSFQNSPSNTCSLASKGNDARTPDFQNTAFSIPDVPFGNLFVSAPSCSAIEVYEVTTDPESAPCEEFKLLAIGAIGDSGVASFALDADGLANRGPLILVVGGDQACADSTINIGVVTVTETNSPTISPTSAPTGTPTGEPTLAPTSAPTGEPTLAPTSAPTFAPTRAPTTSPTEALPCIDETLFNDASQCLVQIFSDVFINDAFNREGACVEQYTADDPRPGLDLTSGAAVPDSTLKSEIFFCSPAPACLGSFFFNLCVGFNVNVYTTMGDLNTLDCSDWTFLSKEDSGQGQEVSVFQQVVVDTALFNMQDSIIFEVVPQETPVSGCEIEEASLTVEFQQSSADPGPCVDIEMDRDVLLCEGTPCEFEYVRDSPRFRVPDPMIMESTPIGSNFFFCDGGEELQTSLCVGNYEFRSCEPFAVAVYKNDVENFGTSDCFDWFLEFVEFSSTVEGEETVSFFNDFSECGITNTLFEFIPLGTENLENPAQCGSDPEIFISKEAFMG